MENSPTEGEQQAQGLENQPTQEQAPQTPAAEQNQETNSREQSQEVVSDDTAQQQTQNKAGDESDTDDGLANFAKSQGFDPENLTDNERRALKIAHDNQKAFREKSKGERITDTTKKLGGSDVNARIDNLEYERHTDKFFSDGRDRNLESTMAQILTEKVDELSPMMGEQQAKAYAYQLSRDLDTLYAMAERKSGASTNRPAVDEQQIRREERESINKQYSASTPAAHSTQSAPNTGGTQITQDWINNTYDPKNPEHRKLVDEYYSSQK